MTESLGFLSTERELTDEELHLISWLLDNGKPEAASYRAQLAEARVVGTCTCGCPTVDLGIRGQGRTIGGTVIIADCFGRSRESILVGVILHVRDGVLSELEVYDIKGEAGGSAFSLPPLDTLTLDFPE